MKSVVIFDSTRDENGRFQTGCRATMGTKYVTIEYLTNWQGDRDKRWRCSLQCYEHIPGDTDAEKVANIVMVATPEWQGPKIR